MKKLKVSIFSLIGVGLSICAACSSPKDSSKEDLNKNDEVENYQETIKTNKRLDELSKIAENFSYTQFRDSTVKYNAQLRSLAEDFIRANDSIAEEYIRSTFWNYLSSDLYPYALEAGKRVYDMRQNRYGRFSDECWEWLQTLQAQAFKNNDLETLTNLTAEGCELAIEHTGYESPRLLDQLTLINNYADTLITTAPDFTVVWLEPYYKLICKHNISPELKESYESILNHPKAKK